jgi:hypothetical protein
MGYFDYLDMGCFSKQHENFCWSKIDFKIIASMLCSGFSTAFPSPPCPPPDSQPHGNMKSQCIFLVDSKKKKKKKQKTKNQKKNQKNCVV